MFLLGVQKCMKHSSTLNLDLRSFEIVRLLAYLWCHLVVLGNNGNIAQLNVLCH